MIALGTHQPMSEEAICERLEITLEERARHVSRACGSSITNGTIRRRCGTSATITRDEIRELTGGLFAMEVPVKINARVFDYDQLIIIGPVFPHEVVGFLRRQQVSLPRRRRARRC